jgi:hypothetical protein
MKYFLIILLAVLSPSAQINAREAASTPYQAILTKDTGDATDEDLQMLNAKLNSTQDFQCKKITTDGRQIHVALTVKKGNKLTKAMINSAIRGEKFSLKSLEEGTAKAAEPKTEKKEEKTEKKEKNDKSENSSKDKKPAAEDKKSKN